MEGVNIGHLWIFMNFYQTITCGENRNEKILYFILFFPREKNFYLRNAARRVTCGSTTEQNGSTYVHIFPMNLIIFPTILDALETKTKMTSKIGGLVVK